MKKIASSLLVISVLLLSSVQNSSADEDSTCKKTPRIVSISGEASVSSPPDMAVIDFTIETQDSEFRKAREKNASISAKVLNSIRSINLSEKNINLKNLNVNEWREYDQKERKSVFKGYRANRNFQVSVYSRDLKAKENLSEKVAQVVNAVSENGITRLGSVNYSLENDYELKNKALAQAVLNAKEKATILVTNLGAKLGKVISVSENSYSPKPYVKSYARVAMSMDAESSSMPESDAYSAGEMSVSSTVNVSFSIE